MLPAGTRIGSYEIVRPLGAGGMGEVYRAHDSRLGRDVALKLLPDAFAADADRVMRFEREARALAALNHPHIAQVYGLEQASGSGSPRALVMELIEGEDLAERLARGPIPVDECVAIARQIAAALDAAHTAGIVHRDLKPSNIKVRPDGTIKVLDFGLAKPGAAAATGGSGSAGLAGTSGVSVAMTSPALTLHGVILGTATYMSPEQARGYQVDKRSDIWAFGCVLYEMLAGRPPFTGDTLTDVLGAIVKTEADLSALPADTPRHLRRLVARCLRKDAGARLRDIGDAVDELQADSDVPAALVPASRSRTLLPWAVAATAIAVAIATVAIGSWRAGPADSALTMLHVAQDPTIRSPRIAPDGRSVVYVQGGRLVVRRFDELDGREIAKTENAANPFWSADGASVGYFVQGSPIEIRMVSLASGTERVLVSGPVGPTRRAAFPPFGAVQCGSRVVFVSWNQGLLRATEGQAPEVIAPIDASAGETNWAYPTCLPDGRILAVLTKAGTDALMVLEDGQRRATLLTLDARIEWPAARHDTVLFHRTLDAGPNSGLWALPVARDLSASTGPPQPLMRDAFEPSLSTDGRLVALTGWKWTPQQLVWVDRAGQRLGTFGRPQTVLRDPAISPDGARVAVSALAAPTDAATPIWLHAASGARPLSTDSAAQQFPSWSPDGRRLAYVDRNRLMVQTVDAPGGPVMIVEPAAGRGVAWTADGASILYADGRALRIVTANPAAAARQLLAEGHSPAVSPDGRLLAYVADAMGRDEVFLTTLPEPGPVWPVSVEGGRRPRWHPSGKELFFTGGPRVGDDPNSHRDLFVISVESGPRGVTVGTPQRLFDAPSLGLTLTATTARSYDVAPDGRLLLTTSGLEGAPSVTVIDTLDALLKARR